jgi:hypothetical protein
VDGPDERGIDLALLYRPERVEVVSYQARQGCAPWMALALTATGT